VKYVKTLLADTDIPADVKLRLKKRLRRLKKRWNKHGNPPVVNLKGSKGRLLKADMDFNSVSPKAFFFSPTSTCAVPRLLAESGGDVAQTHGEGSSQTRCQRLPW